MSAEHKGFPMTDDNLLFKVIERNSGKEYRIHTNGMVSGFEEPLIFNRFSLQKDIAFLAVNKDRMRLEAALRDIRDKIEEQIDGDSRGDTMYSEWVRELDAVIVGATR